MAWPQPAPAYSDRAPVTAAVVEEGDEAIALPLSIEAAAIHLRQDEEEDGDLIREQVLAAADAVERAGWVRLMRRRFVTRFPRWPLGGMPLTLPACPLSSVVEVRYRDPSGGAWTVLDPSRWEAETNAMPGLVSRAPGYTWPGSHVDVPFGVEVKYFAGYADADTLDLIPGVAMTALRMLLGHLYENREAVLVLGAAQTIETAPVGWQHHIALLRPSPI